MKAKSFVAGIALAATLLAACGGSGAGSASLNADEQAYVAAMMQSFEKDNNKAFTASQAQCLAENTVKTIGVDNLRKAGITAGSIATGTDSFSKLDPASVAKFTDLIFNGKCFNFGDMMVAAMNASSGGKIPAEKAKCLGQKMGENQAFRKAMTESMTGNTTVDPMSAFGDIFKLLSDCNISLSDLSPSSTTPSTT